MSLFLDVALPVPLRDTYTYCYAGELHPRTGVRVKVPFGNRTLVGIVIQVSETTELPAHKLKQVLELIDAKPMLPEELLQLCQWGASYYQHPLGEVLAAATPKYFRLGKTPQGSAVIRHTQEGRGLPATALKRASKQQAIHQHLLEHNEFLSSDLTSLGFSLNAVKALLDKGLIQKTTQALSESEPPIFKGELLQESPLPLNDQQTAALQSIRYHQYQCSLLHGETGSGKTEVYLHAVSRVLQSHHQALILIPEIGLSPQTISRFQKRFNTEIAVLHSGIPEAQRAEAWTKAKTGHARIVIGTRLACLTPFMSLGIIIVDEEHDSSFKQQDGFKYSARDMAIYRANKLKIPIILGSATPSLESLHNVNCGKYQRMRLSKRAGGASPPSIKVVDLKKQNTLSGLSQEAIAHIEQCLAKQEQALIFLNRRGYAPSLICHSCGWTADCQHCDVRMTVHSTPPHLACHYCDRHRRIPSKCPQCASEELISTGFGTQQLESALQDRFPNTPVVRVDRDSTRKKNSLENKLAIGQQNTPCVFVGTQMLAKGHHLPNLTLVIIIDADYGLLSADYRSLEHMGQQIVQVAGRAGRESKSGTVLVQSHHPEHPLLQTLLIKGHPAFSDQLLKIRQQCMLPPFWYAAVFRAESKRSENSLAFLEQTKKILATNIATDPICIAGPYPAAIEKMNGLHRFTLRVTAANRQQLHKKLSTAIEKIEALAISKRARWSLEIDPLDES